MKNIRYMILLLATLGMVSCDKHEIEYRATPLTGEMAEIQLHYFVPLESKANNHIYKMEIAGKEYVNNNSSILSVYNGIPSGSVGRFYAVNTGDVNIKLYKGPEMELTYDKNVKLSAGKQNVFVYDFDKEPIVFDNGYPYEQNVTMDTDSTCWVKFYHFLYEKEGEYSSLKLQYQYQYTKRDGSKSEWINIGDPIGFGETTGWQPIRVIKEVYNSSGKARVDYNIKVQDANGEYTVDLQTINKNGKYIPYSDYWNNYIGRRYHHVLKGMRSSQPIASVSNFTAL
jgi:hypothetical protein